MCQTNAIVHFLIQFFLSEDCSSSFFCTDMFGEDEGCLLECPEGQVGKEATQHYDSNKNIFNFLKNVQVVQFVPAGSETTWECVEENGQLCVGDLR